MKIHYGVLLLFILASVTSGKYLNEWGAEIPGGIEVAEQVARQHGYYLVRKIEPLKDSYLLRTWRVPTRSKRGANHLTKRLSADPRVSWTEQQTVIKRSKRGFIPDAESWIGVRGTRQKGVIPDTESWIGARGTREESDHSKRTEERAYDIFDSTSSFNDELWGSEWYLHEMLDDGSSETKLDHHVIPVWAKGITGKGVVVSVLDDGLERNHDDLYMNYDPWASTDLNDDDDDPTPRYDPTNENKHGTRCAGEIAMSANNSKCGVGVAFNSNIGGVRMLDGLVTDELEARAIAFNHTYVDIYSASWGPTDDGRTLDGPGKMAMKAFEMGVEEGRNGKGAIYVWASGNGGRQGDNCDCDGYTGSIYTMSISSATQARQRPWYVEDCASTIATAYSSGEYGEKKISSTDLRNTCTEDHSGTSAAAPLAAGILALVLEANPELTWRDMQHLVTWTSSVEPLMNNDGWKRNGAGFFVSNSFGFGLLNADMLVQAADPREWTRVQEKSICTVNSDEEAGLPAEIHSGEEVRIKIYSSGCKDQDNEIGYLEHIQTFVTVDFTQRGALSISILSPMGTETQLLSERPHDQSEQGMNDWPFLSVQSWGESPSGQWEIRIRDRSGNNNTGLVRGIRLVLHGTKEEPDHIRKAGGTRTYSREVEIKYKIKGDDQTSDDEKKTNRPKPKLMFSSQEFPNFKTQSYSKPEGSSYVRTLLESILNYYE